MDPTLLYLRLALLSLYHASSHSARPSTRGAVMAQGAITLKNPDTDDIDYA